MTGLRVSESELRALFVTELEAVDTAEFDKALLMSDRLRIPLERALAERGRFPFDFLLEHLAQAWKVGFANLRMADVQLEALRAIREDYARAHLVVAFERRDRQLKVAMWDPRERAVIEEIQQMTRVEVLPFLAPEHAIRRAHLLYKKEIREMMERTVATATIEVTRAAPTVATEPAAVRRAWRGGTDAAKAPTTAAAGVDAAAAGAIELVNQILEYAVVSGASDIHVEPFELDLLVRYRVDGVLQEVMNLPPAVQASLVARLKVLSGMRLDEHRVAQDGRFEADVSGFKIDLRVSTVPTHWGEKVVLRVLAREATTADLDNMGLTPADYDTIVQALTRPFGMILATGPTGSGKSTTLYAMLRRVLVERQNAVNISTVEDPVEYTMPRVNQVPIAPLAGFDFAGALRALLRQDPDVIMVGEIRDRETVDIGVRAALVGRLFLSSLHTNDATAAVPRLLDMGVEPFLLASTLVLVVSQRLARRICVSCRESLVAGPMELKAVTDRSDFADTIRVLRARGVLGGGEDPLAGLRIFRGRGCPQCKGTGFRGRLGVFELLSVDEAMRQLIMHSRDADAIRRTAIANGMNTMYQDGLAKALLGETTLEEVFRVAL
jgi:type IV pilus assembly protein PilB